MGSEWKKIVLGDLLASGDALLQTGPFGTALKAEEYTETGVPLISVREIREGFIEVESKTPRVDSTVTQRLPKFVLRSGDILFARKGGVERNALITEREHGWFVGSDGIYLRLSDKYCSEYYSYVMRSPQVKKWLLKNCEGTTMPSLNQKILSRIPIFEPPLIEQRKVAKVLRAFDKKISLNNHINQTLEHMAQTLFKSWFVDFDPVIDNALDAGSSIPEVFEARVERRKAVRESADFKPLPDDVRRLFPSEFEESELGWLPKGWRTSNVGKEFDVTMGQSPPGSTYNEIGNGTPFFQGKADFEFRFPNNRVYCTEPKRLANKRDTLISVRAPVGTINLASQDCAIGRGLAAVRHVSGSPSYTYYSMWNLGKHFEVFEGEGTVFGSINQKDFKALPQNQIPSNVVAKFDELSTVWDKKIELGSQQIQELTKLRDILLPKLISGELRLDSPEFEQAKALVE